MIGSLSAVGDIVYAAEFTNETTGGYMMRSGRRVLRYPRGTYTPVISDGRRLYLTGYSSITALQSYKYKAAVASRIEAPRGKPAPKPSRKARPGRKAAAARKGKVARSGSRRYSAASSSQDRAA